MPLKLTGRHMTISETTREYIDKKVIRLRRLVPKIDEMTFTLSKEKLLVDVEATFKAGKIDAIAKTRAEHVNEAIDFAVDKLEAQITKTKKKISDKSNAAREAAKVDGKAIAPDPELDAEAEMEMEEQFEERQAAGS